MKSEPVTIGRMLDFIDGLIGWQGHPQPNSDEKKTERRRLRDAIAGTQLVAEFNSVRDPSIPAQVGGGGSSFSDSEEIARRALVERHREREAEALASRRYV